MKIRILSFVVCIMCIGSCAVEAWDLIYLNAYALPTQSILDCNTLHRLDPPVSANISFRIFAIDTEGHPLEGKNFAVSLFVGRCNNKNVGVLSGQYVTAVDGNVEINNIPVNYLYDNDRLVWTVTSLQDAGFLRELRYDMNTTSLFTQFVLEELE